MDKEERLKLMIESGRVTIDFGEFHKYAEELMGHPIWSHEFADPDINLELKVRLLTKHKTQRTEDPISSLLRVMS